MRKYRMSYFSYAMCLVIFVGSGCQPSQSQAVDMGNNSAEKLEQSQQTKTVAAESKDKADEASSPERDTVKQKLFSIRGSLRPNLTRKFLCFCVR